MALAATAGVAGLSIGVPGGAGVAAEERAAVAEGCVGLHAAVTARAGALECGGFVQGGGHGFSLLRAAATHPVWRRRRRKEGHGPIASGALSLVRGSTTKPGDEATSSVNENALLRRRSARAARSSSKAGLRVASIPPPGR